MEKSCNNQLPGKTKMIHSYFVMKIFWCFIKVEKMKYVSKQTYFFWRLKKKSFQFVLSQKVQKVVQVNIAWRVEVRKAQWHWKILRQCLLEKQVRRKTSMQFLGNIYLFHSVTIPAFHSQEEFRKFPIQTGTTLLKPDISLKALNLRSSKKQVDYKLSFWDAQFWI